MSQIRKNCPAEQKTEFERCAERKKFPYNMEYQSYAEIAWKETLTLSKKMFEKFLEELPNLDESVASRIRESLELIDTGISILDQAEREHYQKGLPLILWAPKKGCAYQLLMVQLRLIFVKESLSAVRNGEEAYILLHHLQELHEILFDFILFPDEYIACDTSYETR